MNNEKQEQHKYKVAFYARFARESDEEVVAVQQNLLRDFGLKLGFENSKEYCDNGYSGLNIDRPAFSEMKRDIETGEIDVVIVKDISRIARDYSLIGDWIDYVDSKGIRFITTDGTFGLTPFPHPAKILNSLTTQRRKNNP